MTEPKKMQELVVSPEFTAQYGQLMLTIGNEMHRLITSGDEQLLHEMIQSVTYIMEVVKARITEEYGADPEAIFKSRGWSC